jgi:hypothetical protein
MVFNCEQMGLRLPAMSELNNGLGDRIIDMIAHQLTMQKNVNTQNISAMTVLEWGFWTNDVETDRLKIEHPVSFLRYNLTAEFKFKSMPTGSHKFDLICVSNRVMSARSK